MSPQPTKDLELAALRALPSSFPPRVRTALQNAIEAPAEHEAALAELLTDEHLRLRAQTFLVGTVLERRLSQPAKRRRSPRSPLRRFIGPILVGLVSLVLSAGPRVLRAISARDRLTARPTNIDEKEFIEAVKDVCTATEDSTCQAARKIAWSLRMNDRWAAKSELANTHSAAPSDSRFAALTRLYERRCGD